MNKTLLIIALFVFMVTVPLRASAAEEHEPVDLTLYTMPSGGIVYTLGFALVELINKNSDWLNCQAVETSSTFENMRYIVGHDEKKNTYLGSAVTITVDQLALGKGRFKDIGPWKKYKWIGQMAGICAPLITLDPEIKTGKDLAGKTLGLDTMGSTNQYMEEWMMEYAWNNKDEVRTTYGNTAKIAIDRLIDGTIDVTWTGAATLGPGEYKEWTPMPPFERLLQQRQVHVLQLKDEDAAKVRKETGASSYSLVGVEAKEIGKSDLPRFKGYLNSLGWLVHEDMDPAIVKEIVRIIYENADKFADYHSVGKGITKDTIGELPVPNEDYHPAAREFLEERGHEVGR